MTKRQLIDEIVSINHTAEAGFLAQFEDIELDDYLRHLHLTQTPRMSGDARRFDHYFDNCPTIALTEPTVVTLQDEDDSLSPPPGEPLEEDEQDDPEAFLDLNVSEDALFNESYDVQAGEEDLGDLSAA